MAYNSNPGNEDMYSDAEPAAEEQSETPAEERSEGEGQTAMLPKSILAGKEFKPGDEVVLKIVAMQDDSVVVEYAPEKGGEYEKPAAEAPASAPDEYGPMME